MEHITSQDRTDMAGGLVLPVLFLFLLIICFIMIKKFHFEFEPVHIFLINYFGTQALHLVSADILAIFSLFPGHCNVCFQYNLSMFTSLSFTFGIFSMQMDRFLAIYWNVHYKARVTTSKAMKTCCLSPLIAASIAICFLLIDHPYSQCIQPISLLFTRTTNFAVEGIPKLLAVAATVLVSIYAVKTNNRLLKSSVHPSPVNLVQPAADEEQNVPRRNIRRLTDEPDVFYITNSSPNNAVTEEVTGLFENDFFLMVQNTTTMNLITLIFLIGIPPPVIFGMLNLNCDVESNECDKFIDLYEQFNPIRFVCVIVQIIVVLKRLCK